MTETELLEQRNQLQQLQRDNDCLVRMVGRLSAESTNRKVALQLACDLIRAARPNDAERVCQEIWAVAGGA